MSGAGRPPAFTVAMLAGGRSSRMGVDKATLSLGTEELGERVLVSALLAGASQVLAVGGRADALAAQGWTTVADRWPGEGPLGGIISALSSAAHPVVVVLACDLPDVDPAALTMLVAELDAHAAAVAAVPVHDGRREVLHAAYRRSAAGALEERFLAGERSPSRALAGLEVVEATVPDASLVDVDTPEDLDALRDS